MMKVKGVHGVYSIGGMKIIKDGGNYDAVNEMD